MFATRERPAGRWPTGPVQNPRMPSRWRNRQIFTTNLSFLGRRPADALTLNGLEEKGQENATNLHPKVATVCASPLRERLFVVCGSRNSRFFFFGFSRSSYAHGLHSPHIVVVIYRTTITLSPQTRTITLPLEPRCLPLPPPTASTKGGGWRGGGVDKLCQLIMWCLVFKPKPTPWSIGKVYLAGNVLDIDVGAEKNERLGQQHFVLLGRKMLRGGARLCGG